MDRVNQTSKRDKFIRNGILISPDLLPSHELIGLFVRIRRPSDPTFDGLSGFVVDETKNTLKIETVSSLLKTVPKSGTEFTFILPENDTEKGRMSVKIQGNILLSQPQNRIKNLKKLRN